MKITVFRGVDGNWYWRLAGRNGEIMAQSESYSFKSNAKRAARRISTAFLDDVEVEVV